MLRVSENAQIAQFEKANLQIKTVRLEPGGSVRESMSFRNIDFFELSRTEAWEESEFFDDVSRRFLFCVFRREVEDGEFRFAGAFFWNMPAADLKEAGLVWKKAQDQSRNAKYGDLPRSTDSAVAHIRTKGRNNRDLVGVPNAPPITKRCFWLNRKYVREIIRSQEAALLLETRALHRYSPTTDPERPFEEDQSRRK
jgi:hypothetical protein